MEALEAPPQETVEKAAKSVVESLQGYEPAFRLEVLEKALNEAAKPKKERGRKKEEHSVEQVVKDWLLSLPYTSKLAVCIYSYYLDGDHCTYWIEDVRQKFDQDIIAELAKEVSELPDIEKKLTGLVCESMICAYHL